MTTLMKRRKRNRLSSPLRHFNTQLMTPWYNEPSSIWNRSIFPSSFNDMRDMFEFDDAFNDDFFEEDSLMPSMNVKEHQDDFEIEIAAPGFTKKDFEVSIDDNVLHISGEKSKKDEEKDEDYTCKEFSYKSFKKSSTLPEAVDLNQKVKATYKNGILQLSLLKKDGVKKLATKKVIKIE